MNDPTIMVRNLYTLRDHAIAILSDKYSPVDVKGRIVVPCMKLRNELDLLQTLDIALTKAMESEMES